MLVSKVTQCEKGTVPEPTGSCDWALEEQGVWLWLKKEVPRPRFGNFGKMKNQKLWSVAESFLSQHDLNDFVMGMEEMGALFGSRGVDGHLKYL